MPLFHLLLLIWHLNFAFGILFAPAPCGLLLNRGIYPGMPCLNMPVAGFQGAFGTPIGGLPAAVMPSLPPMPMPMPMCSPPTALCAPPLAAAMPTGPVAPPMMNLAQPVPPSLAPIVPPPRILQPPQPAMAPPMQLVPVAMCAMPCRKKAPCRMPMRNNGNGNNFCDFCCGPCCCPPCEDDICLCSRRRRR
ncbi:hypothetical protein niasHT_033589 [Heterodera trifolii]|uniref:Uncharacterized protein n=1 Tax=Heterodera trifolii TaxID=157864 RepID=A0ABD2I4L3_9BILA